MDYEKKYKEALERATFYNNESPTKEQRKMLLDIFPELKSEDERIRKAIIGYIEHGQHYNVSNKDMIAWLEKQSKCKIVDADEVIEWLEENSTLFGANWCHTENIIENFKEDFDL